MTAQQGVYLDSCMLLSLFLADSGYGAAEQWLRRQGEAAILRRERLQLLEPRASDVLQARAWLQDTNSPTRTAHPRHSRQSADPGGASPGSGPSLDQRAAHLSRRVLEQAVEPVIGCPTASTAKPQGSHRCVGAPQPFSAPTRNVKPTPRTVCSSWGRPGRSILRRR